MWQENNDRMQDEMRKMFQKQKPKRFGDSITQEEIDEIEEEARKNVLFYLFKLHHLLRTNAIEGIYSKHGTTYVFYLYHTVLF